MRKGFTLIELMIVIAIIAIIAAIAVPNLLENRIIANEAAAAASLNSGVFAGEVSFQGGGYLDASGDGAGEYCPEFRYMAGTDVSGLSGGASVTLQLLGPEWNTTNGAVQTANFNWDLTAASQLGWAAGAAPKTGNDGRRPFYINVAGGVYTTTPSDTPSTTVDIQSVYGAAPYTSKPGSNWKANKK